MKVAALLAAVFIPMAGHATTVNLLANDASGTTSFNAAGHWSNTNAPVSTNDYNTAGFQLRSPGDANSYTFAGASLTCSNNSLAGAGNGSFLDKYGGGSGTSRTLTINNFTNLAGALVRSGAANGTLVHIAGNHFTIAGTSELRADQTSWIVDSPLLGGDNVVLTNHVSNTTPPNHISYTANNSGFTGGWVIFGDGANASTYTELVAANSMPANPSTFKPAQITIGPNGILLDTAGSTFNNANGGFTFTGNATINTPATTIIAEPMTGGFGLTKTGAGTLKLSAGNTYTGTTTISTGTLQMGVVNAVTNTGSVTDNSTLDLNGNSTAIDALNGTGTVDTVAGGTPTLTVGANGGTGTLAGVIQNTAGTLSFVKAGAGTETLSGGYTYGGQTLVAGGTLKLTSAGSLPVTAGDLVVSNGAVLAVDASSGTPLPAGNLVVGTNSSLSLTLPSTTNGINASASLTFQDNATNNFNYGNVTANPAGIAINAAGGISAPGTNIVINISAVGLKPGTLTLIKYTGTVLGGIANFSLNTPPGVAATLVNNTNNHSIDLNITSAPNQLSWYGGNSSNWDITTVNWSNAFTASLMLFQQYTNGSVVAGDSVVFDDTLTNGTPQPTNINVTGTFYAFPFVVNSTLPYSFGGSGGITGSTTLVKSNSGSLTLQLSNSFTGGVSINGGSVIITNDSALGAGSGTITLNTGALLVNGNITNSRAFSVPASSTIDVATNVTAQLGGPVSGAGGLDKTDLGTLILTGTNTLAGALTVSQGNLNVSGTHNLPAVATVGDTGGVNAFLNITGGAFAAVNNAAATTSGLLVGSTAGSSGDIRLSGGTLMVRQQLGLGAGAGGYAALTMTGGAVSNGSYVVIGFNNDLAVLNMSAGTFGITNANVMTIAAGGTGSIGVVNLSGGTFNGSNGIYAGETGNGTLNLSGGAAMNLLAGNGLLIGRIAGSSGTVNLDGGTLTTISATRGAGSAVLNFNGGTLKAAANTTTFINGLSSANIYNNGATIDDGGRLVTFGQPLLASSGSGVSSIPLSNGGSGYIDTPIVTITGGTGSNATATATVAGGAVTAVTVTCPGQGYLNTDTLTVTFSGGGASPTVPTVGTITFAPNGTGGLTKKGAGTLTSTGVNTFGGPITNTAGTLSLTGASTYAGGMSVNAGTVLMTTTPIITGGTTISNAASLVISQVGSATSSLGNLTFSGKAVLPGGTLGLSLAAANNSAVPVVSCGTLTLNGTNTIGLAGALKTGTIALLKYSGAIAGTGNCTNLVLPQGGVGSISNDVADSILFAVITSTGPGLVWTGTNSNPALTNLWDINSTTNWLVGATAAKYLQPIIPGDSVTFNDIGSGTVVLNTSVQPGGVLISNNTKSYTISGSGTVAGPTGLQKLGTGTAILNLTNNIYAGITTISNGTLQVGNAAAISSTANVLVGPAGTLELAGFNQTLNELTGSGIVDNNNANDLVLTVGSSSGGTWNGSITDHGLGGVALAKNGTGTWVVGGSNRLGNGSAFLVRDEFNAGTTIITNGGALTIPFSELRIADGAGLTSTVVVAGGTLTVSSDIVSIGDNAASANGTLIVNSGTVIHGGGVNNVFGTPNNIIVGAAASTGTLIVNGGQVLNSQALVLGQNTGANGTLLLNGGLVQATGVQPAGTPTTSIAYFNGGTLQATASNANFLQVQSMVMSNGLVLDDGGFPLNISSVALQAGDAFGGGLAKQGAGTVYLDAGNTYTGTTMVNNGTLAGTGSVAGPVVVGPGGKIGAGNAGGTGAFALGSTSLTIQGGATMRINKTGGTPASDVINGISAASYGGTLFISNVTSDTNLLANGDSFTLFNATAHSGNFSLIEGSPGPGLGYSFNPATGVLSVVAVASNPTNITLVVNGTQFNLSWPSDHLGWILQSQTNSAGISTNWVDLPGTPFVISTNFNINLTNPAVFYRLRSP